MGTNARALLSHCTSSICLRGNRVEFPCAAIISADAFSCDVVKVGIEPMVKHHRHMVMLLDRRDHVIHMNLAQSL